MKKSEKKIRSLGNNNNDFETNDGFDFWHMIFILHEWNNAIGDLKLVKSGKLSFFVMLIVGLLGLR